MITFRERVRIGKEMVLATFDKLYWEDVSLF